VIAVSFFWMSPAAFAAYAGIRNVEVSALASGKRMHQAASRKT